MLIEMESADPKGPQGKFFLLESALMEGKYNRTTEKCNANPTDNTANSDMIAF
jgi:hypothetical protein